MSYIERGGGDWVGAWCVFAEVLLVFEDSGIILLLLSSAAESQREAKLKGHAREGDCREHIL